MNSPEAEHPQSHQAEMENPIPTWKTGSLLQLQPVSALPGAATTFVSFLWIILTSMESKVTWHQPCSAQVRGPGLHLRLAQIPPGLKETSILSKNPNVLKSLDAHSALAQDLG